MPVVYNLVPDILWWGSLLSPLLLRISIALLLLVFSIQYVRPFGQQKSSALWMIAFIHIALSFCFFIGVFTQYASLLLVAVSLFILIPHPLFTSIPRTNRAAYFLLFSISLSLFFMGAGPLALDSSL